MNRRGRPPKGTNPVKQVYKPKCKQLDEYAKINNETYVKLDQYKRGRKRGRKTKEQSNKLFTTDEILGFLERNYSIFNIEENKQKILEGLTTMKEFGIQQYIMNKFIHNDNTYYYDDFGSVINIDGKLVGIIVKQNNEKKIIIFDTNYSSYDNIMKTIEY